MKTQLKGSFFQVFGATLVWLTFILTRFFAKGQTIPIDFIWNIIGASFVCALILGVLYTVLWNHFTLKPIFNIIIGTAANTLGGYLVLLLLFKSMFSAMLPFLPLVLMISFSLHSIAFYFYAKYERNKEAKALNGALPQ